MPKTRFLRFITSATAFILAPGVAVIAERRERIVLAPCWAVVSLCLIVMTSITGIVRAADVEANAAGALELLLPPSPPSPPDALTPDPLFLEESGADATQPWHSRGTGNEMKSWQSLTANV